LTSGNYGNTTDKVGHLSQYPTIIESDDREYRDSGVPSTVAIAGHPLHPLSIIIFPIALLAAALGSDFGYWLTRDPFWARASLG